MAGFNDAPLIRAIAVPAVCLLVAFLGYFSQLVFNHSALEPGPLSQRQTTTFNILLLALWVTYYRSVTTDPGRYIFEDQVLEVPDDADTTTAAHSSAAGTNRDGLGGSYGKWCKKCQAPKPPRAHHCRICGRCVPKMDHHCPWTRNCVSMTTFPHFLRFLVYANVSLWYLGRLLYQRCAAIWEARNLPAYLGPSVPALASLAVLGLTCFVTSCVLGIMLVTTIKGWVLNRTLIEGWELERHESLMQRSSRDWWDITGPDGNKIRLESTEFPYDVGFFTNMAQAMGTSNFLLWLSPLAGNPRLAARKNATSKKKQTDSDSGWVWPENGFNRREGMWPPPDPDKIRQSKREWPTARRNLEAELREATREDKTPEQMKRDFQDRQNRDLRRRRRALMDELEEEEVDGEEAYSDSSDEKEDAEDRGIGNGWTDIDGDRLHDLGVDEDAEDDDVEEDHADDDDDTPIGELLRRRQGRPVQT